MTVSDILNSKISITPNPGLTYFRFTFKNKQKLYLGHYSSEAYMKRFGKYRTFVKLDISFYNDKCFLEKL